MATHSMDGCPPVCKAKEALERIIQSRSFARAEQLRRLLSYLVENALGGAQTTLKETVIGVDVFDLPVDFDPKADPMVRMGMRRLRSRLRQYYENEGSDDPFVISLEPGNYVPKFLPRDACAQRRRVSLTVLPFEVSSEADREISGVFREALLMRLGENQSFHLHHKESALLDLASFDSEHVSETNRDAFLLRGSYAASDKTIELFTELFSREDNRRLWSGLHRQAASAEVWTIQNQIAAEIEERLVVKGEDRQKIPSLSPMSERGLYRLIIQGRYHLHQNSSDSLRKSLECFRSAVSQQPSSAKAWAGLAVTHMWMVMYHMVSAEAAWQTASHAVSKAVTLDPDLTETHLALALLDALSRFCPVDAGVSFERALAANPEDNSVRIGYAMTHLAPLGRLGEAENQLESALASDPLNVKALQMMALVAYFGRRYEDAAEIALSALDIQPRSIVASFTLANCHERLGREEMALQQYRKCEDLLPLAKLLKWSTVMAAIYKGRVKWVRPTVLAAVKILQASSRAPAALISDLLIRLGETDRAVQWMERAFRDKAFRALFLGVDPAYDSIRRDPRCVSLLQRLHSPSRQG